MEPMIDGYGTILLDNSALKKKYLEKVAFFMFAEGGAMGEPGCILWLGEDGKKYHCNYCFGDVDFKKVAKLFPVINECKFELFGYGSEAPEGWEYVNLGTGNHLIVNEKYHARFSEETKELMDSSEFYQNWQRVADKILGRDLAGIIDILNCEEPSKQEIQKMLKQVKEIIKEEFTICELSVDDREDFLLSVVKKVVAAPLLDITDYEIINEIDEWQEMFGDDDNPELDCAMNEIFCNEEVRKKIEDAAMQGKATHLAKAIGVPFKEE